MKQENNPIPESVQQSDEELKKLGAIEKNGTLKVRGKAHEKVLNENKQVDTLRTKLKRTIKELTDITGSKEYVKTIPESKEKKLSPEQAELVANLELQYPKMVETLKFYEMPLNGMPTWEAVKRGLTPEVLEKALKLERPTLLLIPSTSRQSKVKALDAHKVNPQKYDTENFDFEFDDLWNGGEKGPKEKQWKVRIVEGVQDIQADPEIDSGKMNNYDMAKAWVKKYAEKGLDVMNDADAYLTLMMASLSEGKPIDEDFYTVLNGQNVKPSSLVAVGYFHTGQVALYGAYPAFPGPGLRLRGSVGVDVQKS